jgi:hypothetical protein
MGTFSIETGFTPVCTNGYTVRSSRRAYSPSILLAYPSKGLKPLGRYCKSPEFYIRDDLFHPKQSINYGHTLNRDGFYTRLHQWLYRQESTTGVHDGHKARRYY